MMIKMKMMITMVMLMMTMLAMLVMMEVPGVSFSRHQYHEIRSTTVVPSSLEHSQPSEAYSHVKLTCTAMSKPSGVVQGKV